MSDISYHLEHCASVTLLTDRSVCHRIHINCIITTNIIFSGPGSTGRKAASPKPPSGGGAFKKMKDDDDDVKYGFQLNAAAGWNLKF